MMTHRIQMSIVIPPAMLLCIGLLNYINNSFHRNKVKARIGRVFITAQFAFAFYLMLYAKNRNFVR